MISDRIPKQEIRIYEEICNRMDELLTDGVAIGIYWGVRRDGNQCSHPFEKDIRFYSVHGASVKACGDILPRIFKPHGCPNAAWSLAEVYYKETRMKKEEKPAYNDDEDIDGWANEGGQCI